MMKANISNVKRVLNIIVEQIIHITRSNNINTNKLLPISCFRNRQTLHITDMKLAAAYICYIC